ncbi:MAG TPA: hypothetical protein VN034_00940 [Sphingopyxis sp.]|nr:hypothetical protein [Sphingopyxis sp.]
MAQILIDDGRNLESYIDDQGAYNAAIAGVSASASATANATALQAAVDHVTSNGGLELQLPPGVIEIDGDIVVNPFIEDLSGSNHWNQITIRGIGAGRNGTWLKFTSGSLRVRSPAHMIRDLRVSSADADGIVLEPTGGSPNRYPVRAMMSNVRVENCAGSGIVLTDMWEYLMIGVFARYNANFGIEGREGIEFDLGCNALTILGGQMQGNGTIGGSPIGSGGSAKSSGGGIRVGSGYQVNLYGVTLEGNVGDGLVLAEEVRGLLVDGVYFEKNGRHPEDRDIRNDQPGSSPNGPNSIIIRNSNFTPQQYNGTIAERAIDLYDVHDLRIVNPQFLTSGGNGYSAPPIRIRESTVGRATGWIEGRYYGSIEAYPTLLTNDTARFGFPRKQVFSTNLEMTKGSSDTTFGPIFVRMPKHCGRRVDVNYMTRPDAATGTARIVRDLRRGPAGTPFSNPGLDVNYDSTVESVYINTNSSHNLLPGGHLEIRVTRDQGHANDTLAASLYLQSVEVVTYEGVISALETS